jgi:hypothetical protein
MKWRKHDGNFMNTKLVGRLKMSGNTRTFLTFLCFVFSKSRGVFSREDFQLLYPVVDGFSIMTYDYSSHGGYV